MVLKNLEECVVNQGLVPFTRNLVTSFPLLNAPFKIYMQNKIDYTFPLNFNVESTNACNLSCKMCPRKISNRKVGFIEWKLFKKIVDE